MSRPDPGIAGPTLAVPADIDAINELFSQSFTDRYHRDGMAGVRVPYLNPAVWRYAIADAGEGALVWRDREGQIVAFNMVHRSGREGWMGPLAIRTDLQGRGLGRRIVTTGVDLLRQHGATTIGLETMPRTVENIGFYTRLGFRPGHLTVTLSREVTGKRGPTGLRLSATGEAGTGWLERCRALAGSIRSGADYTREIQITAQLGLGDATLLVTDGALRAYALWHSAALAADREPEELRILKLVADAPQSAVELLNGLDGVAAAQGLERITLRAETARPELFGTLVERGYEVLWTDLRMTLAGFDEPVMVGGVVYSNWEI